MKITSYRICPAPFIGALVNGAFGLIENGIDNHQQKKAEQRQHERQQELMQIQQDNALAQMAQSQEYNEKNMAIQNQYQIDAENRANAYNSVGAQVARARAAGVSPAAALGSGGAGGLMSVSSAPSSSTPSPSGASGGSAPMSNPRSNLGSLVSQGMSLDQLRSKTKAETQYFVELARGKNIENYISEETKHLQVDDAYLRNNILTYDSDMKEFDASIHKLKGELEISQLTANINLAAQKAFSLVLHDNIDYSVAEKKLLLMTEEIALTASKVNESSANVQLILSNTKLAGAQYLLSLSEADYKNVLTSIGIEEKKGLEVRNELEKHRADFEDLTREKTYKQAMRNQKWQNATNILKGASAFLNSIVNVAGAIATGGASSALSGLGSDVDSGTNRGWTSNGSGIPFGSTLDGYPTTF